MAEVTTSNSDVAAIHNIIHKRGDSFWRGWEYYSDPDFIIPIDIQSSDFKMEVRSADRLRTIFTFSIGSGLTITGVNRLEVDLAVMAAEVKAGAFVYDLQKTLSNGRIITIMEGEFLLNHDVTQ